MFLEVLKKILLDSAFEEVVGINVAVDVLAKLMEHDGDHFDRTMSLIAAEIFGEEDYVEEFSQNSNSEDSIFGRRREQDSQPFSPGSNVTEASCVIKPGVSTGKGLVILTRALSWSKRINDTVRTIYSSKIINSLEVSSKQFFNVKIGKCNTQKYLYMYYIVPTHLSGKKRACPDANYTVATLLFRLNFSFALVWL